MKNQEVRNTRKTQTQNSNPKQVQAKNANQVVRLEKRQAVEKKKEDKPKDAREVNTVRYRSPWKSNQVFTVTTFDDGRILSRCREN